MWERHITDPLGPLGANRETREESEQSIRTVQKATEHYEWVAQWRPWPPSYLVAFLPWVRARPRGKRAVGDWGSDQEPGDWRRLPFKEITMSLSEASVFQMERSRFAQSYKWLPFQQGEKTSPSLCWPKLSLPFPCQTFPFPRSESTKAGLGSDLRKTRFFFLFFFKSTHKSRFVTFSLMSSLRWSLLWHQDVTISICLSEKGSRWPRNPPGSKSEVNFPFPKFPCLPAPLSLQPLACLLSVYVLESEKGTHGHKSVGLCRAWVPTLTQAFLQDGQASRSIGPQK